MTVESHATANFSKTSTIVGAGTLSEVFSAITADRDGDKGFVVRDCVIGVRRLLHQMACFMVQQILSFMKQASSDLNAWSERVDRLSRAYRSQAT